MKYSVTRFKSMEVALKEMKPFINGVHLQNGKPFKKMDNSSANVPVYLVCINKDFSSWEAGRTQ